MTTLRPERGVSVAWLRLLQLASPTLPVGGFSYSQGLEAAVEDGSVRDAGSAERWIGDVLDGPVGTAEAAFMARFLQLWALPAATAPAVDVPDAAAAGTALIRSADQDAAVDALPSTQTPCAADAALAVLDGQFQASRESAQLLAETRQMGWSLVMLGRSLDADAIGPRWAEIAARLEGLLDRHPPSYLLVWSAFATACELPPATALQGWLWSWLENQAMAALKTVPLGQTAGQGLLFRLSARIPPLVTVALHTAVVEPLPADRRLRAAAASRMDSPPAAAALGADPFDWPDDHGPGNFAPGFGIACARHETQYSRLFRS